MKKVLAFIDDVYEDLELWYPKLRLEEAGHQVVVAASVRDRVYKGKHGYPCVSDASIEEVEAIDFDAVLIPGGFAPDRLRRYSKVLECLREFDVKKKLIAFICHGGWVAISAKILKGRKATSTIAIKDDMENAGAIWTDQALVVDKNVISSRTPKDLPQFAKAMVDFLAQ